MLEIYFHLTEVIEARFTFYRYIISRFDYNVTMSATTNTITKVKINIVYFHLY